MSVKQAPQPAREEIRVDAVLHALGEPVRLTIVRALADNPAGISCGTDCSQVYSPGTTVTLTATPFTGSRFDGWSGACSGWSTRGTTTSASCAGGR